MTENPDLVVCRQKAKELKRALGAALGDVKEDYWDTVRDFLTGRITREHFDLIAKNFLCKEKIKLHNEYVLTVIKCIMLPLEATESFFSKGVIQNYSLTKKRLRSNREEKDFMNRQELKKIIRLMGKKEREKLKALPQELVPSFPSFSVSLLPHPNLTGQAAEVYSRGIQLPLCTESRLLPNLDYMRDRLNSIVLEHDILEGSDEQAADVLLEGLETHLENLIKNCLFKIRLKKAYVGTSGLSENNLYLTSRSTISSRDLLTTFTISPYLLTERPNALEKLITIHNPAFPPELSVDQKDINFSTRPRLPTRSFTGANFKIFPN